MSRLRNLTLVLAVAAGCNASAQNAIVCPSDAPAKVKLAAKEIRRFVYLRTGDLLPVKNAGHGLALSIDTSLDAPAYQITKDGIAGGSDLGVLYGAYRYAELLGVRFYLHEDVVPDERLKELPVFNEEGKPAFKVRGILPFHDFTQGPDLWEADDYKAVVAQLTKLRMNFLGLHTYNYVGWGSEPTVWVGMPEDIGEGGRPKFSYAAFYANTERTTGGQKARRADTFGYGASELFESAAWGPSVMRGLMPQGKTLEEKNEVFARSGKLLDEAFKYAHRFGVKTCVGTEIPLTHPQWLLPPEVRARLKEQGRSPSDPAVLQALYRGTFLRAMQTYPLDYYWLWTGEGWRGPQSDAVVQDAQDDLLAAVAAAKEVNASFTLATAGWALGPSKDRTLFNRVLPKEMPFSCINGELGTYFVDEGFARLKGHRPGWAIPWLEDDLCLNSMQLWVGRTRRDAYDAARFGCEGLMGIHWRTEEIGPQLSALAQAQWTVPQPPPEPKTGTIVVHGGNLATCNAQSPSPVYRTARWDTAGYDFTVPNGNYRVTLQFVEPAYTAKNKRVFGITLQGRMVERRLDVFERVGKDMPLDLTFENVEVARGSLNIGFLKDISSQLLEADRKQMMDAGYVDFPCIAGIVIEGPKTIKVNCGGPAWDDYIADPGSSGVPRNLPTEDFYRDWVTHQFGPEAVDPITAIFVKLDGQFPMPDTGCPGGLNVNGALWEHEKVRYAFVEEMAALMSKIRGAGQRARFAQWLGYFKYLRSVGETGCALGHFYRQMDELPKLKDEAAKRAYAKAAALPARIALNEAWGRMATLAIETANTWGGIGVVMGHELMNRGEQDLLHCRDAALETALGEQLPAAALPWMEYRGAPKLFSVTKRTLCDRGESLKLRIIALPADRVTVHLRTLGAGPWQTIPATHLARAVYEANLPAAQDDFEYYITAGQNLVWPPAAPDLNQTVVVAE